MSGKPQLPWPPDDQLLSMVDNKGPSWTARKLGCSRGAVAGRVKSIRGRTAHQDAPGKYEHADGTASLVSDAVNQPPAPWKPEDLLRVHGLDPKEWEIVRVRGNRWGEPDEPKHQLRVDVIPRSLLLSVPDPGKWTPPPKPKKRRGKGPRSIVICGDHHAPHDDRVLHKLFCEWLADEKPDEGVLLGDLMDFASISRHRPREGFAQAVNECLARGLEILQDYRHSSPDTQWYLLRGNHDDRLPHQILDNTPGLHAIKPGGGVDVDGNEDERDALNMRRLLYLDELGIKLVDEDWDRGKVKITRRFTARHGYTAAKNSTEQMLSKLAHSTVQGHTHRLSLRYRTEHDDESKSEPTSTRLAGEAGCMAEIKDGLGYTNDPDWQQGALLCHAWPDDDFHLSPLVYVPGRLLAPGGKRYGK